VVTLDRVYKWEGHPGELLKMMNVDFRGETMQVFLKNMKIYNDLFEDTKLTLQGAVIDENGELKMLYSQRFIKGKTPDYLTLKSCMEKRGFICDGNPKEGIYRRGNYIISDVHPRNVFIVKGKIKCFDVIVENEKEYEYE
jgi:hypothetical protein